MIGKTAFILEGAIVLLSKFLQWNVISY
jgi:hypothetical protein